MASDPLVTGDVGGQNVHLSIINAATEATLQRILNKIGGNHAQVGALGEQSKKVGKTIKELGKATAAHIPGIKIATGAYYAMKIAVDIAIVSLNALGLLSTKVITAFVKLSKSAQMTGANIEESSAYMSSKLKAIGGIVGGLGLVLEKFGEETQELLDTFKLTSEAGATFGQNMFELKRQSIDAGVAQAVWTEIFKANTQAMALFGGSLTQGSRIYSKVSGEFIKNNKEQFARLGITQQEAAEFTAVYLETIAESTLSQRRSVASLSKGVMSYLTVVSDLAILQGKSRDQIKNEMKGRQLEAATMAKVRQLELLGDQDALIKFRTGLQLAAAGGPGSIDRFKEQFVGFSVPFTDASKALMIFSPALSNIVTDMAELAKIKGTSLQQLENIGTRIGRANQKAIDENLDPLMLTMATNNAMLTAFGANVTDKDFQQATQIWRSAAEVGVTVKQYLDLVRKGQVGPDRSRFTTEGQRRATMTVVGIDFQLQDLKKNVREGIFEGLQDSLIKVYGSDAMVKAMRVGAATWGDELGKDIGNVIELSMRATINSLNLNESEGIKNIGKSIAGAFVAEFLPVGGVVIGTLAVVLAQLVSDKVIASVAEKTHELVAKALEQTRAGVGFGGLATGVITDVFKNFKGAAPSSDQPLFDFPAPGGPMILKTPGRPKAPSRPLIIPKGTTSTFDPMGAGASVIQKHQTEKFASLIQDVAAIKEGIKNAQEGPVAKTAATMAADIADMKASMNALVGVSTANKENTRQTTAALVTLNRNLA